MVQLTTQGSEPAINGMDPALKPRLRRRSGFEYAAWIVCTLLALGILDASLPQRAPLVPEGLARQDDDWVYAEFATPPHVAPDELDALVGTMVPEEAPGIQ